MDTKPLPPGILRLSGLVCCIAHALHGQLYVQLNLINQAVELSERNMVRLGVRGHV